MRNLKLSILRLSRLNLLFLAAGLVISAPAMAQDKGEIVQDQDIPGYRTGEKDPTSISGFVAAGVVVTPEFPGSDDSEVTPALLGKVNYGEYYYAQILGPQLEVNLFPSKSFNIGPVIGYDGGRDDVDNDTVDRLDDVDESLEIGAFASYAFADVLQTRDELEFSVTATQDIADGHDGFVADFDIDYSFPVNLYGRWRWGLGVGTTYVSESYSDSYFSVSAAEQVATGLNQFDAGAGFNNVSASISANYLLTDRWGIYALGGVSRLLDDAADSPIVEQEGDDTNFIAGAAISYRF